jgi:hypothetical protein
MSWQEHLQAELEYWDEQYLLAERLLNMAQGLYGRDPVLAERARRLLRRAIERLNCLNGFGDYQI